MLPQVEGLAETRHRFETIVEKQEGVLDKKVKVLKEILQENQNQFQNKHLRLQEVGLVYLLALIRC